MDVLSFYKNNWHGKFNGTDEELQILAERSIDIINQSIFFSGYTVKNAPEIWLENVEKAVCCQIDFINENGGIDGLNLNPIQSASVGKFSYTTATNSVETRSLCDLASSYLLPTGLLYRGVYVSDS